MSTRIHAAVLVFALIFSMGLSVYAETGGAGNGMVPEVSAGAQGRVNIAATTDNDMDWGWIGLLGLIGLAGLAGRNRNENPNRG